MTKQVVPFEMNLWSRQRGLFCLALVGLALVVPRSAWSDVPIVYHSPNDDGVPLAAPMDVAPGSSQTLYLYIDGGSDPSPEIRCATGSGDEICFWNVVLRGTATVTITDFTPTPGLVHHLDPLGASLGINGGDPWRGDLGPRRIGELVIDGGANGGALELFSGESLNASLGVEALARTTIVPEPSMGLGLGAGILMIGLLGSRRSDGGGRTFGAPRRPTHLRDSARRRALVAAVCMIAVLLASGVQAQTSIDCGDVVADGVIDAADLDALRRFLAGDPTAPDLQGDPMGLARCDVSGDGLCGVADYARIRRYMIELTGGLDGTCPLAGATYAPVVLAAPVVDQGSSLSTDRASVDLTGTADPGDVIRIDGGATLAIGSTNPDGTWSIDAPLSPNTLNILEVRRDFGGGYLSDAVQVSVSQTDQSGSGVVRGVVVGQGAGSPLVGASVSIHGQSTTTDSGGRFEFDALPAGRVVVRVDHPGYVPQAVFANTNTVLVVPNAAVQTERVEIELTPMASPHTIGPAGGSIITPSGIELSIPAGSLPSDTDVIVTEILENPAGVSTGIALVDIGPGPITFDPPAILRLPTTGLTPGLPVDFLQTRQANRRDGDPAGDDRCHWADRARGHLDRRRRLLPVVASAGTIVLGRRTRPANAAARLPPAWPGDAAANRPRRDLPEASDGSIGELGNGFELFGERLHPFAGGEELWHVVLGREAVPGSTGSGRTEGLWRFRYCLDPVGLPEQIDGDGCFPGCHRTDRDRPIPGRGR